MEKKYGLTEEETKALWDYAKAKDEASKQKLKDSGWKPYCEKVFGEGAKSTGGNNPDYTWKHYKDDDNVQIVTGNVQFWANRNTYVLWVDNNKVVYLKPWQVEQVKQWNGGNYINQYVVKLNRQYFKPYTTYTSDTFKFDVANGDRAWDFDYCVEIAKEQDKKNTAWKLGHY